MPLAFGFHHIQKRSRELFQQKLSTYALIRYTFRQALIVFSAIPIFIVASKDQSVSRLFLFTYFPLLYCVLLLTNKRLPSVLARHIFGGQRLQPTIVLGSPGRLIECAPWLEQKTAYGLKMIGAVGIPILEAPPIHSPQAVFPLLGSICELPEILSCHQVTQLIVLEVPSSELIHFLSTLCDKLGIRLLIVNDLPSRLQKPISFMEDDGIQILAFRPEPLECPVNRILKRILDIAISLPVVAFVLPVTNIIVYCLQRWDAPGALFFKQPRTGLHNEEFMMFKYRTMCMHHGNEVSQATLGDPRVFPAGRWLRRHSIDELPQFLNVLRGEMSIVGPRPHLPEHSRSFNDAAMGFKVRAFIKPGITGLAQVEGFSGEIKELRNLTDRVRSDLYYLENWSISLEWRIILKTARQIIFPPKAAY